MNFLIVFCTQKELICLIASGAQIAGRRGGGKSIKSALILGKKCLDCVHLWVKFLISNTVLRIREKKLRKLLFSCVVDEMFIRAPLFQENYKHPLPLKIPGCVPVHYYSYPKYSENLHKTSTAHCLFHIMPQNTLRWTNRIKCSS